MKILHVFPSSYIGGSELCALETIASLKKHKNVDNYAIFPEQGQLIERAKENLVDYTCISHNWWMSAKKWNPILKLKMLRGFFKCAKTIKNYIKQNNIDVVITHSIVIPTGALAAKKSKVSHIWYIHEYGDQDHHLNFNYGKKTTLKLIDKLSNAIIVNSKALKSYFENLLPTEKINQIYYAVNYPLTTPLSYSQPPTNICMVGRIAKGKNQLIALKAINILKQKGINFTIEFVGGSDETYLKEINDFIDVNHLNSNVKFVDFTNQPWLNVQKSDIVIVCSKNEAFGRVTIEGMKSGKIVVASITGAGQELINHEKNGFSFSPYDETELANILYKIFNDEYDLNKIAASSYKYASVTFSESNHAQSMANVVQKIINNA